MTLRSNDGVKDDGRKNGENVGTADMNGLPVAR